jgi:glutaredoxin
VWGWFRKRECPECRRAWGYLKECEQKLDQVQAEFDHYARARAAEQAEIYPYLRDERKRQVDAYEKIIEPLRKLSAETDFYSRQYWRKQYEFMAYVAQARLEWAEVLENRVRELEEKLG